MKTIGSVEPTADNPSNFYPQLIIRVLYVEDNPQDADQTLFHFAEFAPEFVFEVVKTGQKCLERLSNTEYDLLLLDNRLPDTEGLDLLKHLMHSGTQIPVILVTGTGDNELVVKALKLGAANYVPKIGNYLESLPGLLWDVFESQLEKHNQGLSTTSKPTKLLYIESNPLERQMNLRYFAENAPHLMLEIVGSNAEAMVCLEQANSFDAVLFDQQPFGESCLDFVRELKLRRYKLPPFVVLADPGDDAIAIATLKLGVADYVTKRDDYLGKLIYAIEQAVVHDQLKRTNQGLRQELTERKRAEDNLRRRADEFAALFQTANDLARSRDLPGLLDTIVERVISLLSVPYGSLELYSLNDDAFDHSPGHLIISKGFELPLSQSIQCDAEIREQFTRTGFPLIIGDYSSWEKRSQSNTTHPFGSVCLVPLLFGGDLLGVLTIAEVKPSRRIFNLADADILALLAGQVASAVNDARMIEKTRQRVLELESVNKISTALRSALTVDAVLPLLIDDVLSIIGTDAGMLWLKDDTHMALNKVVARGWLKDSMTEDPLKLEEIFSDVMSDGQAYLASEFASDSRVNGNISSHFPAGWGGACIPIKTAETSIGGLLVTVQLPRTLLPSDLHLLTTLAEIAGSAIQRIHLYDQTEQHLQRLTALHVIDLALSASMDVRVILGALLDQLIAQLHVDAADILLYKSSIQTLEYTIGRGFRSRSIEHSRLRMGDEQAGRAVLENRIIFVPDLTACADDFSRSKLLAGESFVTYFAVPLIAKGQIKGVLEIFYRNELVANPEWLDFLETLGNQASIAIDNAEMFQGLERSNREIGIAYEATIEGWSHALDLRDKETEGHTRRVTEMTERLARASGFSDEQVVQIRRGALLHDMGKMGVPDSILLKPDKLTEAELLLMRQHPKFAYDMFSRIAYLKEALDVPYCHHEKWDGSGYPQGLKGEQIPLSARLFSVVDIWDALKFDRPYRKAWPEEKVLEYIRSLAGTHLDPQVVELFLQVVKEAPVE